MQTPKFVLITLDYPPEKGGVARYLGNLVNVSNGNMRVFVERGSELTGPGQIEVKDMFRMVWPTWWPIVSLCWNLRKTKEIILVSHVFPIGTAAWISRLLGGAEYVVLFHGLDLRLATTFWKKWLLRRICAGAKSLFVNSESTKRDLLAKYKSKKITVLTPGVRDREVPTREEARKKLGIDLETPLVITVGRLVSRKGIDNSLKAVAEIQKCVFLNYAIIGNGADFERLQHVAAEARARVQWITYADEKTKWTWFAAADVFLMPAREEVCDVEGFGIVYLEAALTKVPSIAGRCGGAPEAVKHEYSGLLVDPGSIQDIQAAIVRLFQDEQYRKKMGEQARTRALNDFKWSDRWETICRVINESK